MLKIPTDRTHTLINKLCPYCGVELTPKNRSLDHVVARKFVPEGTMVDSCNIGLRACKPCNGHKARLEDDISAITMLPTAHGDYARDDERLIRTSQRKASGAVSDATRKKVRDSQTQSKVNMNFGGAQISIGFVGAPHIDQERASILAWSQIQGIWFFQTYDKERGYGRYLPQKDFHLIGLVGRRDWGNVQIKSFEAQIADWDYQSFACLADGYFRAIVKASPDGRTLAWALEWNESYRVFGYWDQGDGWQAHRANLTELKPDHMVGDTTNGWAFRTEIPLSDDDPDVLFAQPPNFDQFEERK